MKPETLQVNINHLPNNRIAVELEVPAKRCKASYKAALTSLSSSIRLPGFRPGRIPTLVIIQHIGMARIKAAALEKLINKVWQEVIAEQSINPVSEAELKEDLQSLVDRFNPDEKVTFTLEAIVDSEKSND